MISLYEFQKQYLADLPPRAVMAADTGTGKTFMALAHYEKYGNNQHLIILAPASKVRTGDWEREIEEYFADKPQAVKQFSYEIYSYEKFSREPNMTQRKKGQRAIWRNYSPAYGGQSVALIADEVHRAKNPQSGIGKAVYQVAKQANFFVGLSATPLPNGWIDFANYSKIFGFTKHITEFRKRYVHIVDYKGFPEIVGYWHKDELAKQWQSISKKLTKAQALDLPERVFIGVDFKKPPEYTKTILERKDADGNLLDNPSLLAHALRQTLTTPKLNYLIDLIKDTHENIVIFYNYVSEREAILGALNKLKTKKSVEAGTFKLVFRQDGEKHELPRKEDWPKINNSVTLSHYRSGATGVEMTYATQVIYFSPTYSYADYKQSIGRVYRHGQTQKTTFYNFRTPNTIEEDVYKALSNKNDFQASQWKER